MPPASSQPTVEQTPAEDNQQAQAAIADAVGAAVASAFLAVDVHNLADTLPRFKALVGAAVTQYGKSAAALALLQYRAARRDAQAAGIVKATSSAPTLTPVSPDVSSLPGFLDWATAGLWTPKGAAVDEAGQVAAKAVALAKAQGVAEGLTLTAGQDTTFAAIEADPAAKGWARVPEPGACSFCLMLAARGARYTSRETADFRAHHVQPNGTGGECRCSIEPQFSHHYEPTAQVREAQHLWETSTKGLTGKAARDAFRRAVEGRTDSPLTRLPRTPSLKPVQVSPEAAARIGAQLDKALATMRANNTAGRLDTAIAATERRLAKLRVPA